MVMSVTKDNILEHHTGIYSCGNSHILVYTLTNLHPVTQYPLVITNKPFTLIWPVNESPRGTPLVSADKYRICPIITHHLIKYIRV